MSAPYAPEPTEEDLKSPLFNAIWNAIKGWDIRRTANALYANATGTDVMRIMAAVRFGQPMIDYGKGWDAFQSEGLARPGTLIETDDGTYLIGHINEVAGICDDCTELGRYSKTIITRYAVVVPDLKPLSEMN